MLPITLQKLSATMAFTSKMLMFQLERNGVINHECRWLSLLRRLSFPIAPMNQSHHVTDSRLLFFSSQSQAIESVEEPVVNHTYSDLIRNRKNETYEPIKSFAENNIHMKRSPRHRFAKIVHINNEKGYALLKEEGTNDRVFLNFGDIDPCEIAKNNLRFIKPFLRNGLRVTFDMKPNENEADERKIAINVRRSNGGNIPLLRYNDALSVARNARAWLGHRCYEILTDGDHDPDSIAEKIHNSFEQCNESMKWVKTQLAEPDEVIKECKAELGQDVYDILENVVHIDDIQQKVDDAFLRCARKLNELEKLGVRQEQRDARVH